MFKKIILSIIGIYFILNLNVQAEELPTFKVGSATAYKDETITIPITLSNNSGFGFLGVKIRYDTEKLEYVDSYITAKLSKASLKGIEINAKKTITLYALTSNEDDVIKDNGKIAEIKFKVLSNTTEDVKVEATIDNFGKGKNEEIKVNKIDGTIHITTHGVVGKNEDLSSEIKDVLKKDQKEEKITWQSSNEKVATVDAEGNVTFKKNGTAKIEALTEDGTVIYEKSYKVDKKTPKTSKKINNYLILGGLGLIIVLVIIFLKLKNKKRQEKEN